MQRQETKDLEERPSRVLYTYARVRTLSASRLLATLETSFQNVKLKI